MSKKKRLAAKRAAKRERLLKSFRLDYDKLAEALESTHASTNGDAQKGGR